MFNSSTYTNAQNSVCLVPNQMCNVPPFSRSTRSHEFLMGAHTQINTPVPWSLTEFISWLFICVLWQHVVTRTQTCMCRKPNDDLKLRLAEKMTKLTPRHGQHVNAAKGYVMAKVKQTVLFFYLEKIRQIQTLRNTENGLIKTHLQLEWHLESACLG